MNKTNKTIRPLSILRLVWWSIWLLFIISSLVTIILFFVERLFVFYYIIGVIIAFIFFIVSLYFFLADFKKGVKFDDQKIKISADVADKHGLIVKRFQHKLEVKYKDIRDINIDFSKKDTHNKHVEYVFVDMPNIVLTLKDGKDERINVYYYNRKQKIKIIDIIKLQVEKTGQTLNIGSGKEMWDKAYSKTK